MFVPLVSLLCDQSCTSLPTSPTGSGCLPQRTYCHTQPPSTSRIYSVLPLVAVSSSFRPLSNRNDCEQHYNVFRLPEMARRSCLGEVSQYLWWDFRRTVFVSRRGVKAHQNVLWRHPSSRARQSKKPSPVLFSWHIELLPHVWRMAHSKIVAGLLLRRYWYNWRHRA